MLLNFCNMLRAFINPSGVSRCRQRATGVRWSQNSARPHRRDGFESSETPARHQLVIDQSNISCFVIGDSPTCACMCVCVQRKENWE